MSEHEAVRTLVKSPPELWEVCSDASSLSRHLQPFGEIKITRLEPEITVAWEGERASGTVRIEASAWGTRVTLTALPAPPPADPEPPSVKAPKAVAPKPVPAPVRLQPTVKRRRGGLLGWLLGKLSGPEGVPTPVHLEVPAPGPAAPAAPAAPAVAVDQVEPVEPVEPVAPPEPRIDAAAALDAALDSLGQAHHRPFSRG